MTPDRWKRLEEIYHAARTRDSAGRAAYVAEACGDDEDLQGSIHLPVNVYSSGVKEVFRPVPIHSSSRFSRPRCESSDCSHARAKFQSRRTVSREIFNTSAVSSTERPPKKRSSTTSLFRGWISARRLHASSGASSLALFGSEKTV